MKYKIEKKEQIIIVGIKEKIIMSNNTIPALWEKFRARITDISNQTPNILYSYSDNFSMEGAYPAFDTIAACSVNKIEKLPEGMVSKTIDPRSYIVFTFKGLPIGENGEPYLMEFYSKIFSTILPTLNYKIDMSYNIELMDERFKINNESSELDICIPLIDKE